MENMIKRCSTKHQRLQFCLGNAGTNSENYRLNMLRECRQVGKECFSSVDVQEDNIISALFGPIFLCIVSIY